MQQLLDGTVLFDDLNVMCPVWVSFCNWITLT
jgi:hypothetical protein